MTEQLTYRLDAIERAVAELLTRMDRGHPRVGGAAVAVVLG